MSRVLWEPPPGADPAVARFARAVGREGATYDELWRWSVEDLDGFWAAVWDWFAVPSAYDAVRRGTMPETQWFPGARLNWAERALAGTGVAVVARSQTRPEVVLTWAELCDEVARCRDGLRRLGVGRDDVVAGYLPNIPEAVVALLATASLGAVWACCPPELGARSVVERFQQLGPKVLLAVSGYRHGSRFVDRTAEVASVRASLPSTVVVDVPYGRVPIPGARSWDDLRSVPAPLAFEHVPFDHPLHVLFSSGTTGPPKAIVHGHGGILLEHLKSLVLHHDLGPGDRFCWFSTTGWMMWNYLVSGLCAGATIVLYDGSPAGDALWRLARETGTTILGVGAPYLVQCGKDGIDPGEQPTLRSLGSTGAPLPPEAFRWVHDVLPGTWLTSISGGTDVCTAVVGGSPLVPVWEGEISCRHLGCDVRALDADGRSSVGVQGELVIAQPMPSMPVGFVGDPDRARYRAAYFAEHPGVWTHGDWITITERGSCVISGRSDATLNRNGVRMGTSEFYGVVEALPEVDDSLVVDVDGELLLFVQLAPGRELSAELEQAVRERIRHDLSPRHVPDAVAAVPAIPRTHTGKKLEVPIKRLLAGLPVQDVLSPAALADPSSVAPFERFAAARRGGPTDLSTTPHNPRRNTR